MSDAAEMKYEYKKIIRLILLLLFCVLLLTACTDIGVLSESQEQASRRQTAVIFSELPEYSGEPYIEINGNEPDFPEEERTEGSFEIYSELDSLGRCGEAYANISTDLMPTEERGNIGHVKPTGWHTVKYDTVDGKYLYNRCHLIGYQLTGKNAEEKNLITGTRYLNMEGMLPFENMVADYIKETGSHVLYRVTPIFDGDNLLANGVQMEAFSVEDAGEGISYNVYVYNVQPGIEIDYATGESTPGGSGIAGEEDAGGEIRGNSHSMIYHCPGQADYEEMKDSKYLVIFATEEEAEKAGYRKAER